MTSQEEPAQQGQVRLLQKASPPGPAAGRLQPCQADQVAPGQPDHTPLPYPPCMGVTPGRAGAAGALAGQAGGRVRRPGAVGPPHQCYSSGRLHRCGGGHGQRDRSPSHGSRPRSAGMGGCSWPDPGDGLDLVVPGRCRTQAGRTQVEGAWRSALPVRREGALSPPPRHRVERGPVPQQQVDCRGQGQLGGLPCGVEGVADAQ